MASLAGLLAVTGMAAAQDATEPEQKRFKSSWRFALELGGGAPFGDATTRYDLDDLITAPAVLGFDAAFRPLRRLDFGLTSTFGFGTARGPECPQPAAGCTVGVDALGLLRARYHFSPTGRFEPFAGLGGGIDFLTSEGQAGDPTYRGYYAVTDYYLGPVLAAAHLGFGYRLSSAVSLGLLVDVAVGRYLSVKRQVRGAKDPPIHAYVSPEHKLIHSSPQRRIDSPAHVWVLVKGHVTFEHPR